MRNTLPKAASSTPLNSDAARLDGIDRRCAKASIDINRATESAGSELAADMVSLVFEVFAAIGWADKEAAYHLGMDAAQLSRIKHGQGKLAIDTLGRLPNVFWIEFRNRIDDARGLSRDREADAFAEHVGQIVAATLKFRARAVGQ